MKYCCNCRYTCIHNIWIKNGHNYVDYGPLKDLKFMCELSVRTLIKLVGISQTKVATLLANRGCRQMLLFLFYIYALIVICWK